MLAEQTLLNGAVLLGRRDRDRRGARRRRLQRRCSSRARRCSSSRRSRRRCCPTSRPCRRRPGARSSASAIRVTLLAIAAFAGAVALGLLRHRPVGDGHAVRRRLRLRARRPRDRSRSAMGCHLAAGTLNQAALARGQTAHAAIAWLAAAALFVGWMFTPVVDDELVRAEVGYFGAAALLCDRRWPCSTAAPMRVSPRRRRRPRGRRGRRRRPERPREPAYPTPSGRRAATWLAIPVLATCDRDRNTSRERRYGAVHNSVPIGVPSVRQDRSLRATGTSDTLPRPTPTTTSTTHPSPFPSRSSATATRCRSRRVPQRESNERRVVLPHPQPSSRHDQAHDERRRAWS